MEPSHPPRSLGRQGALVGLPRSTDYDAVQGESTEHLSLMPWLEKQYPDTPDYGVRRMTAWWRSQGEAVHHKRVARRLHTLG